MHDDVLRGACHYPSRESRLPSLSQMSWGETIDNIDIKDRHWDISIIIYLYS